MFMSGLLTVPPLSEIESAEQVAYRLTVSGFQLPVMVLTVMVCNSIVLRPGGSCGICLAALLSSRFPAILELLLKRCEDLLPV
jgi:hypothetical protein